MDEEFFFSVFLLLASTYSFSLRIFYNNKWINSIPEYEDFFNAIQSDPNCNDYITTRERIEHHITSQGPLISPNRGVFGAHVQYFHFDKDGYQALKNISVIGDRRRYLYYQDIYKIPNTDLALPYFWDMDDDSLRFKPVPNIPMLERARIDEISNPKNRFYAFSQSLHGNGEGFENTKGCTYSLYKYRNVVECKPTLDNPLTQKVLRFEIYDDPVLPMKFRTFGGDSCNPFFLITPDKKLKVVGTHSPGDNYFLVENIAFPSTENFIDKIIKQDAEINNLVAQGLLVPQNRSMKDLLKEADNIRIPSQGIQVINNLNEVDDDLVDCSVPEPFPSTENFIDKIIKQDAGISNLVAQGLLVPQNRSMKDLLKEADNIRIPSQGIQVINNLNEVDDDLVDCSVPEPFSSLIMSVGFIFRGYRSKLVL